jgi:hypothetical protein
MHSALVTRIRISRQDYRCQSLGKAGTLFNRHCREFPYIKMAAGFLYSEINPEACKLDRSIQYNVEVQNG